MRQKIKGGKLKETGTSHWQSPSEGATNESGFSALPGGFRLDFSSDNFGGLGSDTYFWSSVEYCTVYAWVRGLSCVFLYYLEVNRDISDKHYGFSVRLVRDN